MPMISTYHIVSHPISGQFTRRILPSAALFLTFLYPASTPTQNTRGFEQSTTAPSAISPGAYYALIIGINDYPSLPHLTTAVHDAQTVGTLLESTFGFKGHVTYLLNQKATRANIMDALEGSKGYAQTLSASDNLLIYYAGHGYYNDRTDKAYWLPFDAESAFSANHISADDLTTAIRGIASHHILIIADSCYSGDLTRGVDDNITSSSSATGFIRRMMAAPSRNILSSGGNEPVADAGPGGHSIFAAALLHALSDQPGPFFTAADLADPVRKSVRAHSSQIPEYTRIGNSMPRNFPIDIGDFVFERKAAAATNPKQPEAFAAAESAPPSGDVSSRGKTSFEVRDHGQALIDAKKYDEALSFANDACNRNEAQGCAILGVLYYNGLGVTKDTARAATLARKACDGGYSGGCRNLGIYYFGGNGVDKDPAQAAALFRTACDAGDAHGCGWLGNLLLSGTGIARDPVQGLAVSRKACNGGDAQGCTDAGVTYENGFGVEKDYAQAAGFYQKGCDGGSAAGCSDLGTLYELGNGVAKDPAQAMAFFRKGCDGGYGGGCNNLGTLYEAGNGVTKDLTQAATLYRKACDSGIAAGCGNLGTLYQNGKGVAPDYAQAATLYRKACDGGLAIHCVNLGVLYTNGAGVETDLAQAVSLFKKGCDGGELQGCAYLSGLYGSGTGVERDPNQALFFAQKSCDGGNPLGCTNLGWLYENGTGVQKDLLKAATLYEKGCDSGEALGCRDLANLYEHGWGVARDRNRAIELLRKACSENDQVACNALKQLR
jgi:uncharacterized protein